MPPFQTLLAGGGRPVLDIRWPVFLENPTGMLFPDQRFLIFIFQVPFNLFGQIAHDLKIFMWSRQQQTSGLMRCLVL